MGTVRYTTVNGKIIAEKRNGVRSRYISDSLGSTVALLDNTQTKTDTFEYWPYGEVRTRTGTNPTPFQHVGTRGYYKDSASRTQVRARELDNTKTRWMTQDPIGFDAGDWNLYKYVANMPISVTDPSGNDPYLTGFPAFTMCNACSLSIVKNWFQLDQHHCSHKYMHCVACCILTKLAGWRCAARTQEVQNFFTWPLPCDEARHRRQRRRLACAEGTAIARLPGKLTCESQCAIYFPTEPGFDDPSACKGFLGDSWPVPPLRACGAQYGIR